MAKSGAERQAAYKKTEKGRMKMAELERLRKARAKGALDAGKRFRITSAYTRRDLDRLVRAASGTDEAMRRRAMRVKNAQERLAKTGSSKPAKPNPLRGGHGIRKTSTLGHERPISRGGAHKEGNVYRQTAQANFGKGGQGSKTILEWRAALAKLKSTPNPARPTEAIRMREGPSPQATRYGSVWGRASIPRR